MSGVASLPGTRDKSGRAVAIITTRNTVWLNPHCNTAELVRLLLYLHSIPRAACRALGLTVLVDARRCSPVPALFKAFNLLQEMAPHCIHGVLLLVERDLAFRMEKPPALQMELLTSMKSLHKHIDSTQLPLELDGTFPYCHRDWLSFRTKLEHLLQGCQGACAFLQEAIQRVESCRLPERAEVSVAFQCQAKAKPRVFNGICLAQTIYCQGGCHAALARLRKEESCVTFTEDYRDALHAAATLYSRAEEGVHLLVMLSNKRIGELELVMEFEAFEDGFREVSTWIEDVGRKQLKEMTDLDDSLELLLQAQKQFREFDLVASDYCRRGWEMLKKLDKWEDVSSADLHVYGRKRHAYHNQLAEFGASLEGARSRLRDTIRLYEFFDKPWWNQGWVDTRQAEIRRLEGSRPWPGVLKAQLPLYYTRQAEMPRACQLWELDTGKLGSASVGHHWPSTWIRCVHSVLFPDRSGPASLLPPPKGGPGTLCFAPAPGCRTGPAARPTYSWGPDIGRNLSGSEPHAHLSGPLGTTCESPFPGEGSQGKVPSSQPGQPSSGSSGARPRKLYKLRHILAEMVTTEREYVRSLRYTLESYSPEMERPDLPQDLRGKRGVIFGNLEKLHDFHSQYFLRELESCCNHPLRVSHCFLRH
uniref:DH domain-containing protein n=1 Tax=Pelodiscus sinensis TaxID=13735 RepID=K7FGS8_PELSI